MLQTEMCRTCVEDINEVVPWFHAALLCGQDVDEPQKFNPRLYKTHQLHFGRIRVYHTGKTLALVHPKPKHPLWCKCICVTWGTKSSLKKQSSSCSSETPKIFFWHATAATATAAGRNMPECLVKRSHWSFLQQGCLLTCTLAMRPWGVYWQRYRLGPWVWHESRMVYILICI